MERNLIVVLVLLLATVSWVVGTPQSVYAGLGDLELTVATDREVYTRGETVRITIFLSNPGSESITINFPSSCIAFFRVEDSSGVVFDLSKHILCEGHYPHLSSTTG